MAKENELSNTFVDPDGIAAASEMSRGINTVSLELPCCGGIDKFQVIYKTPNDQLVLDVFDLITTKMGLKMEIQPVVRKGGGGG